MIRKAITTAALVALASASAGSALAQAAQQPALTHGPALPGVCVFNEGVALGGSSAGQSVAARMKQLTDSVAAELKPEQAAIETEGKTVQAIADKNSDAFKQRAGTLGQRFQNFQQKAALRNQELQATQAEQLSRIATELQPILTAVYQQRKCSVLIDANSTLAYNPAMDITPTVIQQVNAKLPSLTFDRKRLDTQATAQKASAPAAKK